ncbi:hypothetical protein [Lentzea indica]|uniref:hypothetical protein n=1 Tax=Lentzea indica TaxID=2604800 RepID=UPI00143B124A|nr:hypothetical protein [Lentzea indica]
MSDASTDGNLIFPAGRFSTKSAAFYARTDEVIQTDKGPALIMAYDQNRSPT